MVCRLWKAATGITWVEAKDAAENLINAQDGPTTKDDLAKMSVIPSLKIPAPQS